MEIIHNRVEEVKVETENKYSLGNIAVIRIMPPEERRIVRNISLLKELMKNSEKDGNFGIRSHTGLFKGEWLHTI
jgi:hypothetical protein